ncbi:lactonase family protein [Tunturibacter empetritectus]|uniref:6-phosphogluconolactonase (Cycloisomerase 2 family) n=1 Tax=Tunturiibacter lichenicola TaxID=2051959 RepID=A0A7W8N237_9BACT|nr:beta-propeller fold lactonase family protein [Edaphobacter lichenicola]MBB5342977.1 6-phosphogluconolactonase (cycloisomerase 2 family) [Edaphobacter lichenicola]
MSKVSRYAIRRASSLALTVIVLASLGANIGFAQDAQDDDKDAKPPAGAVFAMTNIAARNQIVIFRRANDGTLKAVDRVFTGGSGKGDDFDTQGGLVLRDDHRFLYACNAGSNDISVFAVEGTHLTLIQKIFSGGVVPESLTFHGNLMYVLHGSVADNNISGFTVAPNGILTPLPDSTQALSSPIAVPGVLQFGPKGGVLVVTLKAAQVGVNPGPFVIDTFTVGPDGLASKVMPQKSFGQRPFAATFRSNGILLVAESHNPFPNEAAVSSYNVDPASGALSVISGSVANGQTDSCWILLSKDEHYAYTANFATGNISSFRSNQDGTINLINGAAASLGLTSEPTDIRISADGQFFYVLLRGTGEVAAFRIEDDGSLTPRGRASGGLPANTGASGLAAY